MKATIFFSFAALAVAVFGVSEANAWWHRGPDVDQRISGSSLTVEVDDEGNTQAMLNLLAKGQPGSAHLDSVAVYGPVLGPVEGCPAGTIGAAVVSQNAVETFSDGSLLTFLTTDGVLCTADGVVFTANVTGVVTGGTGRFEDASGTFEASVVTKNSGLSGRLTADLD
jgi:hypothetical protein